MLQSDFNKIVIVVLVVIIIVQILDLYANFGLNNLLFGLFWLVVVFELGVIYSKKYIE